MSWSSSKTTLAQRSWIVSVRPSLNPQYAVLTHKLSAIILFSPLFSQQDGHLVSQTQHRASVQLEYRRLHRSTALTASAVESTDDTLSLWAEDDLSGQLHPTNLQTLIHDHPPGPHAQGCHPSLVLITDLRPSCLDHLLDASQRSNINCETSQICKSDLASTLSWRHLHGATLRDRKWQQSPSHLVY